MKKAVISTSATRRKRPVGRPKTRNHALPDGVDTNDNEKHSYQIRSVNKAFDLLEALCEGDAVDASGEDEVSVSRLSRQLGLNKATVYRLLVTFESRGYVEREQQTGIYRIGMNAYEVACRLRSRMALLCKARPVMEDLCRRCNEAVYLAVRRGCDFLLIDLVESAQQVKVASLLGRRFSLSCGAPGHLMLAYSGQTNLATTSADINLQMIQQQGYCVDQGGLGDLVGCLAAPMFSAGGNLVGALCLVGPTFRMPEQRVESLLLPGLQDASEAISAKLGYLRNHMGRVRL